MALCGVISSDACIHYQDTSMASTQPKHSGQAHFFWPVLWPLFTSSSRPGGPLVSEECLSPTPPRFLVIVLPSTSPTHGHAHRVQYVMEGRTGRFAAALALAVVSFCVWSVSASPLASSVARNFLRPLALSHKQALPHLPHTFPLISSTTHSSNKPTWPS